MRVAFVTPYDSADVLQWSGTGYHMGEALKGAGIDLVRVATLERWPLSTRVRRRLALAQGHGHLRADYDEPVLQRHARDVRAALTDLDPDVVLGPHTVPFARVEVAAPLVLWPDATFAQMHGYMSSFTGMNASSARRMEEVERRVLTRSALAVFPSEWAAASARHDYGLPERRVAVVPYGANLGAVPSLEEVEAAVARRSSDECHLVAIGVDWVRKGLALAAEAARLLNESGLPTTLTVVGCSPPAGEPLPDCVRLEGFVRKTTPDGASRLLELLLQAHFLILPTRAEPLGIVFTEAAACGTPSLAADTGGVAARVTDGVTGRLLSPDAGAEAYRDAVLDVLADDGRYETLALGARRDYETRLNWPAAGRAMVALLEKVASERAGAPCATAPSNRYPSEPGRPVDDLSDEARGAR